MTVPSRRSNRLLCARAVVAIGLCVSPLGSRSADAPCRISPGEWCEIPATALRDVFPTRHGHPAWGIVGPRAVTGAWGGAAFDTKRGLLLVTGGGHGDYGGNEVYEFSLGSMKWRRATEPSRMREVAAGQFVIDDSEAPVSSHTYGGLVYLPNVDRMFKFGGSYYRSGNSYDKHAYLYDIQRRTWARRAAAPRAVLSPAADYDPSTGHVLVATNTGLMSYDPVSDAWKAWPSKDADLLINVAALDLGTRRFVMVPFRGRMLFYDMENVGSRQRPLLKGNADWGSRAGLAYHPPSRQLVLWEGGRDVWTVDSRTWETCKLSNPRGPAPVSTDGQGRAKTAGIYTRWRYVPSLDLFIAYDAASDNVWFYKLPGRQTGSDRAKARGESCD